MINHTNQEQPVCTGKKYTIDIFMYIHCLDVR